MNRRGLCNLAFLMIWRRTQSTLIRGWLGDREGELLLLLKTYKSWSRLNRLKPAIQATPTKREKSQRKKARKSKRRMRRSQACSNLYLRK
jgi:hypothetical protein